MSFIDEAIILVKSGKGGNGAVSFRKEKFVENGGPDGGDGGKGGDVIFQSVTTIGNLLEFSSKKHFEAPDGESGSHKRMTGHSAKDLIVKIPLGTVVREFESNTLIEDFSSEKSKTIAIGGDGGQGNYHFRNSKTKTPYIATKGRQGQEIKLKLELKLLADVAIVGFPNAGKSTLINKVSNSKSKVGDYPFSTLSPKLGVVGYKNESFVVSDIPGLIEGASEGKGLGYEFLRHIERCRIIWHLVDSNSENLIESFEKLNKELSKYSQKLFNKKQLVVASKCENISNEEELMKFENYLNSKNIKLIKLSSHTSIGLNEILNDTIELLSKIDKNEDIHTEEPIYHFKEDLFNKEEDIIVKKLAENNYEVSGRIIKQVRDKYIFTGENAFNSYLKMLNRLGLDKALRKNGVQQGDTVKLDNEEFEFVD